MKRGIAIFILVIIIFIPFSNAQLQELSIKQVNINKDTNQLAILVESNLNKELYQLRFIITDIGNNKDTIISTIPLQAYTSNWYYITYSSNLKELKTLQVEDLNKEYIASYKFTSKEPSFVQEQVQTQVQETLPSKTSYIYSNNLLVAKKVNNQVNYYHSDQISSTSIITDSNSEIVYSSDYLPFGTRFNEQGKEQYTYTGKELDSSSGLYYYGARYYDSSIGRFTQVDPIQDYSSSSYVYVDNNPLVKIDPSGMQALPSVPEETKRKIGGWLVRAGVTLGYGVDLVELATSFSVVTAGTFVGGEVAGNYLSGPISSSVGWAAKKLGLSPGETMCGVGICTLLLGALTSGTGAKKFARPIGDLNLLSLGKRSLVKQNLRRADIDYAGGQLLPFVIELSQTGEHSVHIIPPGISHLDYAAKIVGVSKEEFLKNPKLGENLIGGALFFKGGKSDKLSIGKSGIELGLAERHGDDVLFTRNFREADITFSRFIESSKEVKISPTFKKSVQDPSNPSLL